MKILLIEDHFFVRLSQKIVLNDLYPDATIVEEAHFEAGISQIKTSEIDLILLDIDVPGGLGKSMIGLIRQLQPEVVILMCSAADEQVHALEYIMAGANGYLSKSAEKSESVVAITTVMKKNRYVSLAIQERLIDAVSLGRDQGKQSNEPHGLSSREKEIMHLLLEGKWIKEIASYLNLRANTISTYKGKIFQKMGVTNILELERKTREHQLP